MSMDGGGLVGGMSRGALGDHMLAHDKMGTVAWSADVCSVWVVVEVVFGQVIVITSSFEHQN